MLLLQETPLLNPDGSLNEDRVIASGNIFNYMIKCQSRPYGRFEVGDEVVWFFQQLERGVLYQCNDEVLYKMSDAVKTGPPVVVGRRRSSSFTMRSSAKQLVPSSSSSKSRPSSSESSSLPSVASARPSQSEESLDVFQPHLKPLRHSLNDILVKINFQNSNSESSDQSSIEM